MIKKIMVIILAVILISFGFYRFLLYDGARKVDTVKFVIGVSQANQHEPWRLIMNKELQQEASKYPEVQVVFTDAASRSDKQIQDIEWLLKYEIDILIVSPCDTAELTPVISEVYQKIPVIVMDRAIDGFDYTLFIGPDNENVGEKAGESVIRALDSEDGMILEFCPPSTVKAGQEFGRGLQRSFQKSGREITCKSIVVEDESRDMAESLIMESSEYLEEVDVIVAHNDSMALGVSKGLKKLGIEGIPIIGADGFTGENGGLQMVRDKVLESTVTRPTGGREAMQCALEILNHVSGVPKQIILRNHIITLENMEEYEKNLTKTDEANLNKSYEEGSKKPVLGYAQVGAESAWRVANTISIQEAARAADIELVYREANQSQEAQIAAIREFIEMEVDVIAISPLVDYGWEEIFQEAKDAGIPIILSDRGTNLKDDSLYMTYLGADFKEEGRRAMRWIAKNVQSEQGEVKIMELQGTLDSTPMLERSAGFMQVLDTAPGYKVVYSASGDFTIEGGRNVIEEYIKNQAWDCDVIYSHNDDMAIGAIEYLEKHGLSPGKEIIIVSVDGTKAFFKQIREGKANFSVECSPILGPQLIKAVKDYLSGKELPMRIITDEKTYDREQVEAEWKNRKY